MSKAIDTAVGGDTVVGTPSHIHPPAPNSPSGKKSESAPTDALDNDAAARLMNRKLFGVS
jgi:hypothetical protein